MRKLQLFFCQFGEPSLPHAVSALFTVVETGAPPFVFNKKYSKFIKNRQLKVIQKKTFRPFLERIHPKKQAFSFCRTGARKTGFARFRCRSIPQKEAEPLFAERSAPLQSGLGLTVLHFFTQSVWNPAKGFRKQTLCRPVRFPLSR